MINLLRLFKGKFSPPTSEEQFSLNASDQDVFYCFRLILNRNPGRKEYFAHLENSKEKKIDEIVSKFILSNEFRNRNLIVKQLSDTAHSIVKTNENFNLYISELDDVCGLLRSTGDYEADVTYILKKLLKPGMTFLDVGANIGFFTMLASKLVGNTGKVLAFEPFEYNLKLLLANVNLNKAKNVQIMPFALSNKIGFYCYDDSAGNSGSISPFNDMSFSDQLSTRLVYSNRLDDIISGYERIDVIKIDIEGAEYLALMGAKKVISLHRPIIISEISEGPLRDISGVKIEEYLNFILELPSYTIYLLTHDSKLIYIGNNVKKFQRLLNELDSPVANFIACPIEKNL